MTSRAIIKMVLEMVKKVRFPDSVDTGPTGNRPISDNNVITHTTSKIKLKCCVVYAVLMIFPLSVILPLLSFFISHVM